MTTFLTCFGNDRWQISWLKNYFDYQVSSYFLNVNYTICTCFTKPVSYLPCSVTPGCFSLCNACWYSIVTIRDEEANKFQMIQFYFRSNNLNVWVLNSGVSFAIMWYARRCSRSMSPLTFLGLLCAINYPASSCRWVSTGFGGTYREDA